MNLTQALELLRGTRKCVTVTGKCLTATGKCLTATGKCQMATGKCLTMINYSLSIESLSLSHVKEEWRNDTELSLLSTATRHMESMEVPTTRAQDTCKRFFLNTLRASMFLLLQLS